MSYLLIHNKNNDIHIRVVRVCTDVSTVFGRSVWEDRFDTLSGPEINYYRETEGGVGYGSRAAAAAVALESCNIVTDVLITFSYLSCVPGKTTFYFKYLSNSCLFMRSPAVRVVYARQPV